MKVYYDVANSTERGYDIGKEIRWLGKQGQICEFHMKENGALLGQGKVDFKKVRAAIDDIGYRGAMQIEGAVPPGGKLVESYIQNRKFLREIFSTRRMTPGRVESIESVLVTATKSRARRQTPVPRPRGESPRRDSGRCRTSRP